MSRAAKKSRSSMKAKLSTTEAEIAALRAVVAWLHGSGLLNEKDKRTAGRLLKRRS